MEGKCGVCQHAIVITHSDILQHGILPCRLCRTVGLIQYNVTTCTLTLMALLQAVADLSNQASLRLRGGASQTVQPSSVPHLPTTQLAAEVLRLRGGGGGRRAPGAKATPASVTQLASPDADAQQKPAVVSPSRSSRRAASALHNEPASTYDPNVGDDVEVMNDEEGLRGCW